MLLEKAISVSKEMEFLVPDSRTAFYSKISITMRNTYLKRLCLWGLLSCPSILSGQLSLTGTQQFIDFNGFTGAGFANPAGPGQLNSSVWLISETTNLNRGITSGGETGSGIYAYEKQGDAAFWFQSTGTYLTPGTITLLIQNNTPAPIADISISYDLLVLNDQNRSSRFSFSFSEDNTTFIPQPQLDFISPAPAATNPEVLIYPKGVAISGLNIPQGSIFALAWETDDVAGAGSRDEFGLDNILIVSGPPAVSTELRFINLPLSVIAGQSYELEICATDAAGNIDVGNTDPISLNELSVTGATILTGIQGAGCKTFQLIPTTSGPISLQASNGTLPDLLSANIAVDPGSVFFSEYIEGSGSNRCLEIYNASAATINLGAEGYEIRIYNNGASTTTPADIYPLQGILAPGEVHVICNENAGPDLLTQADQTAPEPDFIFSGDDFIELSNNQGILDGIGRLGEDPGTAWTGGGCSTQNASLIRNSQVRVGDSNPNDPFDPSLEWTCQPKNTWAYLGHHKLPLSATELRIRRWEADSSLCFAESEYVALEVCAFDPAYGFNQADFPAAINISSSGIGPWEIAGLNGGTSRNVDENGCATFYFRNFHAETFRLTASSPGLSSISTTNITISSTCPSAKMLEVVLNPCGNEAQNEYVSLLNGNTALDLADMTIASIDHLSGSPQPNYNYTFNSTGIATPDNPKPCNTTDNVCLQWLNVQDAMQRQMLINLRDELNAISPCTIFNIPNQTMGTLGEIPAFARMIVFLGAGGDGTLGSEGFDDALNNLDFSSYCASGIQNIYLIASTRKTGFGGYFHNQDARTARLIIQGDVYDMQGIDPSGNAEAETFNHAGEYADNQTCVPPSIFPVQVLPVENFVFNLEPIESGIVDLSWEAQKTAHIADFRIERRHESQESFIEIAYIEAIETVLAYQYRDSQVPNGRSVYRIRSTDHTGKHTYSASKEIFFRKETKKLQLHIYPQPASDFIRLSFTSDERAFAQANMYDLRGNIVLTKEFSVQPGKNTQEISLSHLPAGCYILKLSQAGKSSAIQKILHR